MIYEILMKNYDNVYLGFFVVSTCWVAVLLAICVDFYFGIKKARMIGEARTSEGFRRTISKSTYYFALMFFALIFDFFDVISPTFISHPLASVPFVSVFVGLGLVLTEAKSVREKAEDKLRRSSDDTFIEAIKLISKRQDLVDKAVNILEAEKVEEKERERKRKKKED